MQYSLTKYATSLLNLDMTTQCTLHAGNEINNTIQWSVTPIVAVFCLLLSLSVKLINSVMMLVEKWVLKLPTFKVNGLSWCVPFIGWYVDYTQNVIQKCCWYFQQENRKHVNQSQNNHTKWTNTITHVQTSYHSTKYVSSLLCL